MVDTEPQLSATSHALEAEGWNVLIASSAASCMRVARQDPPDIAVVAAHLEHEDGAPLVQRLRALLRTAVTPILGLTDGADEAKEMLAAGTGRYLPARGGNPIPRTGPGSSTASAQTAGSTSALPARRDAFLDEELCRAVAGGPVSTS